MEGQGTFTKRLKSGGGFNGGGGLPCDHDMQPGLSVSRTAA